MSDNNNKTSSGTTTAIVAILAVVFVPVFIIHVYAIYSHFHS